MATEAFIRLVFRSAPISALSQLSTLRDAIVRRSTLATGGIQGIRSVKLVPTAENGRVKSAPNCFASALIKRDPSRLLVVGSNPVGNPIPSSRTDTETKLLSILRRRTQTEPPVELGYAYLPAFKTS